MGKLFLILAFAFLLACNNHEKRQNISVPEKTGAWAMFEIRKEFHNFGTLHDGEIVSYPFWFKNPGEAPLKITGTDTDCGCIQLSVPEYGIAPGDSAYIEVTYNSAGDVGKVIKTITVFANIKEKKIQFHIAADVKNKWIELNN
ncbi:MAG: hypothetical protein A2W90_01775 [Bacteroidetes bacterium GWF2_42_66]|nr:MAG: hypothetical protein A2W90_01775 [Bacteroidetes bacterium GWF2_42_66]HBL77878.1 hypothetical protein [Prolixibacteraceae bacterium]HCR91367.1 hypothetical protein [Prolixibacteraceae bacterium]HCU63359.1 hypothetical protein [Prolixibacteraceae bacterium]